MTSLAVRSMKFELDGQTLNVTTPVSYDKVYQKLEVNFVNPGNRPLKFVDCQIDTLVTYGDIELLRCTVTKTIEAAGHIFCLDCHPLASVKSTQGEICFWNSNNVEAAEAQKVYVIGALPQKIKTPDGHVYISSEIDPKIVGDLSKLESASFFSEAFIDPDLSPPNTVPSGDIDASEENPFFSPDRDDDENAALERLARSIFSEPDPTNEDAPPS